MIGTAQDAEMLSFSELPQQKPDLFHSNSLIKGKTIVSWSYNKK